MAPRLKSNKEVAAINLNADVKKMLRDQSEAAGMSMTDYVERLILEKHYQNIYKGSGPNPLDAGI